MTKIWQSVAFRLALGCGGLVVGSMAVIAAVFYFGTVGVLDRSIDGKLLMISDRLTTHLETRGLLGLQDEIQQLLNDSIDKDREVLLLVGPDGHTLVGNLSGWTDTTASFERIITQPVIRHGQSSISRLLPRRLPNGATLVVGRDLHELHEIEQLVWQAMTVGGVAALLLAFSGAVVLRRQLEHRIGAIRRTTRDIAAGNLSRRIPVSEGEDEFARLNRDINHMLDRLEHLMAGVRDVSNAIAHDLRTPLCRIRNHLDEALQAGTSRTALAQAARFALHEIDDLIVLFERVLEIAEAESGTRRQSFQPVALAALITDLGELYDAVAEAQGMTLCVESTGQSTILGDRNLLANAVGNLLDNALKYAGKGALVHVWARQDRDTVSIGVQDNGPGIPSEERSKVIERFYRLDHSRSLPGHGLGLSIVTAIASLHGGTLSLEDAAPGLLARLVFPRIEHASFPNGNAVETGRRAPP